MKLAPKKIEAFLSVLREGSSVTAACRAVDISTPTAYKWRQEIPEFAAAWEAAIESGTDLLEDEAKRRALKTSDTLLIFLLKGRRPEKFRDNMKVQVENVESEIERELARLAGRAETAATRTTEGDSNAIN